MDDKHNIDRDILSNESIQERTRLFEKYILPNLNLVYSISIRYSYDPQDVQDNYNEALANLFRYIGTYDPEKNLQTWIWVVCKRLIYDLNSKRRNHKLTDDVDVEDIASEVVDDDHISGNYMGMDNYEQFYNDDILDALSKIKPIYREALLLQQAGYKLEEIMEISYRNGSLKSRNIETVKSRLFLAKQQMRNLINRDGEANDDE
ncbi:sigma-70 family RNA polymerase sigma factor [Alistipes sp. OttesenSCG-928-B03]|nr:sigma-70 family RNA polymerase sigma factor [Alistipes sp. OttesenSCG-928-B03]